MSKLLLTYVFWFLAASLLVLKVYASNDTTAGTMNTTQNPSKDAGTDQVDSLGLEGNRQWIVDKVPPPIEFIDPTGQSTERLNRKCCKLENLRDNCLEQVKDLTLTRLGDGVYYFHNDPTTPVTWFRAQDLCRQYGMHLVSIESAQENTLIKNQVQFLLGGQIDYQAFFWTSLNDLDTENTYIWGGTGQPVIYMDWHPGNPDNNGGNEDCGEVWQVGSLGNVHWNDRSCTGWRGRFICEVPKPCADLV